MTDPYRLARPDPHPPTRPHQLAQPAAPRAQVARTLIWVALVVSVAGNTLATAAGASVPVHLTLGAVVTLCVAALVVSYLRGRR